MKNLIAIPLIMLFCGAATAQKNPTITSPVPSAAELRQRISMGYLAETIAPVAETNRGDTTQFIAEQNVHLAYRISPSQSLLLRQYFTYNMSDATQTNEWDLSDHAIEYAYTASPRGGQSSPIWGIFQNPVYSFARLYLPGSDYAREVGKYELRFYTTGTQRTTESFSVRWEIYPRLYAYAANDGQIGARIYPGIYLDYDRDENFVTYVGAYSEHGWRHTGTGINYDMTEQNPEDISTNFDYLYYVVGARIRPLEDVGLHIYFETRDDLRDSSRVAFLSEANSIYGIDVSIGL